MAKTEKLVIYCIFLLVHAQPRLTSQNCSHNNCEHSAIVHQFEMQIELNEKVIHLSWEFNCSEPIYGFYSVIHDEGGSLLYQSPTVHSNERKMTISYELTYAESLVCLRALINETTLLKEKCDSVEISDLKIIVGILAGTIFLIPCIIAMTCILYKDHQVRKLERYEILLLNELISEKAMPDGNEVSQDSQVDSNEKDKPDKNMKEILQSIRELKGEDNMSFVSEKSKTGELKDNIGVNTDKFDMVGESPRNSSSKTEPEKQGSNESKKSTDLTLKVDIDLVRQMAQCDNETPVQSVNL